MDRFDRRPTAVRLRSADLTAPWQFALTAPDTVEATLQAPCGGTAVLTLTGTGARVRPVHACGQGGTIVSFAPSVVLRVRMSVREVRDTAYVLAALDELISQTDPVSC